MPRVPKTHHCEYCGAPFRPWRSRPGRFCSHRCALAQNAAERERPLWSDGESALLEKLTGVEPFPIIVERLQAYQRRKLLPERSATAIEMQIKRLGLSRRCTLDNLNGSELAAALGVPYSRIRNWLSRSALPLHATHAHTPRVRLKDLRDWAEANPRLLVSIDADRLDWLLGDPELVKAIGKARPVTRGKACPVLRVDTGEAFPTIKAAAAAIYISPPALRQALDRNRSCAGGYFVRLSLAEYLDRCRYLPKP